MENEKVLFKRRVSSKMPKNQVPGTIYVETDTGNMYIDDSVYEGGRMQISGKYAKYDLNGNLLVNKIDKVDGKGLSTNDYTDEEKAKTDNTAKELEKHTSDTNNPHKITATQIGAAKVMHSHSVSDLTSGVLPVEKGGTGVNTLNSLFATSEPEANGTASAGTSTKFVRADHVHPQNADLSRAFEIDANETSKILSGEIDFDDSSVTELTSGLYFLNDATAKMSIVEGLLDGVKLTGFLQYIRYQNGNNSYGLQIIYRGNTVYFRLLDFSIIYPNFRAVCAFEEGVTSIGLSVNGNLSADNWGGKDSIYSYTFRSGHSIILSPSVTPEYLQNCCDFKWTVEDIAGSVSSGEFTVTPNTNGTCTVTCDRSKITYGSCKLTCTCNLADRDSVKAVVTINDLD